MSTRPKRTDEKRVPLPSKVRVDIHGIVEAIAKEKDRSISNTVETLLAESPRVKKRLQVTPSSPPAP